MPASQAHKWEDKKGAESKPRAFYPAMQFNLVRLRPQRRLQVRIHRGDRADVEVLNQEVENVGGDVGRQRRAELDVFDPQGEEGEEDHMGLLLIPGEDERERQFINPAVEGAGQGQGDLYGRVGVVALPDVEEPRDAADVAEIFLVEAVLAAGQGQDHGVLRGLFGKLGIVVAPGFGAVAATNQEEVLDGARFHRRDHLVSNA